jgi:hypothetical protein
MTHALCRHGNPHRSIFPQNWCHRSDVYFKHRRLSTAAAPDSFHFIPDPQSRCLVITLQAASVTPLPIVVYPEDGSNYPLLPFLGPRAVVNDNLMLVASGKGVKSASKRGGCRHLRSAESLASSPAQDTLTSPERDRTLAPGPTRGLSRQMNRGLGNPPRCYPAFPVCFGN